MENESALTLGVRFVDESALWTWEIRDDALNRVVQNSWSDEWAGYRTRDRACAAGLVRLDTMLGRRDEAAFEERLEECQLAHTTREVLGSAG